MDTNAIILTVVNLVVVTTIYSWAICSQMAKEKNPRSNDKEPNKHDQKT
jgi:hypothetical protein